MNTDELRSRVTNLAGIRKQITSIDAVYKQSYDAWYQSMGKEMDSVRQQLKAELSEADAQVREEALRLYRETQQKDLGFGVGVRIKKIPQYDPALAIIWAQEHKIAVVPESLDTKAYNKLVLAGMAPGKIDEQPEVTIVRNLEAL